MTDPLERVLQRINLGGDFDGEPCWLFQGATNEFGHGVVGIPPRKTRRAHRVVFERMVGGIAPRLVLHHRCEVPACVNPAHLQPLTQREHNRLHENAAGRNAAKSVCAHDHPLCVENLRPAALRRGVRECAICDRERCARWRRDNRDKVAAADRSYFLRNREARLAYQREWKRRRRALGLLAAVVATLASLAAPCAAASASPNIVLIIADDIRHDDLAHMPRVSELAARGVQFDAALSPIPLCVPARVSLLTGTLPRTHGIRNNRGQDFDPSDTIATRLDAAGYETALFGKYLNASKRPAVASAQWLVVEQPPGWDVFRALLYHDDYGREQSDVLLQQAQAFMAAATGPFFVYLAPTAAHGPLSGPPRCDAREIPPPPPGATEKRWRQRVSALCGLDDLVADIVASRGPDTWVLWTADHGFMLGEGGRTGKSELVLDAVQVPLIVWGPDVVPARRREIVSLVDVSATVLRLAGVGRAGLEGQSFLPLLRDDSSDRWTGTLVLEGQ